MNPGRKNAGDRPALRDLTTLRIGGLPAEYVQVADEDALVEQVRDADARGIPLLVLGGGSNLVVSDEPFDGRVVHVVDPSPERPGAPTGTQDAYCEWVRPLPLEQDPDQASCGGVIVTAFAGTGWDDFVARAVESELVGIESLSGIPGSVGATPIQNVGAYGQEVAGTLARVRTWDREKNTVRTFFSADCGFGYRTSVFKRTPYAPAPGATGRYVVLSVTFQFRQGPMSEPIAYPELARRLGVAVGERAPLRLVRETVRSIRAGKGMVLDAADHDTWSAGSFFTNPILTEDEAAALPADAPRFPAGDGRVKTSAAWLITHAGVDRGFAVSVRAGISTKHSLALTNRGTAASDDIVALARAVRDRVEDRFGLRLVPEPVTVGVSI